MHYLNALLLVNPRRTCTARVTVVAVSVCVCVCVSVCLSVRLSVKSHHTSGASVCRENAAKYSAGEEGQRICGVFSETAPLQRLSIPPLASHTLRITCMRTVHTQVFQGSARAPCCKLSLRFM